MEGLLRWLGKPGPSGFGSSSTAEQVSEGIDATSLTAIVTGATSGVGKEMVRVLALRGATVIIPARSMDSGLKAKESLLQENPKAKLHVMELDLASINSVTCFARAFISLNMPLNILINNAGIMACPFQHSVDGIELQFATNYLGHFLLTNLLLEKLKTTAEETGIEGRIVNVSSLAHRRQYSGKIRFDNINDPSGYIPYISYCRTKLANILHTNELSRRLQGAATTCYVALHRDVKGVTGKYFADCNETLPKPFASDEDLGKRLWEFSQELLDKHKTNSLA